MQDAPGGHNWCIIRICRAVARQIDGSPVHVKLVEFSLIVEVAQRSLTVARWAGDRPAVVDGPLWQQRVDCLCCAHRQRLRLAEKGPRQRPSPAIGNPRVAQLHRLREEEQLPRRHQTACPSRAVQRHHMRLEKRTIVDRERRGVIAQLLARLDQKYTRMHLHPVDVETHLEMVQARLSINEPAAHEYLEHHSSHREWKVKLLVKPNGERGPQLDTPHAWRR